MNNKKIVKKSNVAIETIRKKSGTRPPLVQTNEPTTTAKLLSGTTHMLIKKNASSESTMLGKTYTVATKAV